MTYSLSHAQASHYNNGAPRIQLTYQVTNADGSIDQFTHQIASRFFTFKGNLYLDDPTRFATAWENNKRGVRPVIRLLYPHLQVQDTQQTRIRPSYQEIINNQQQIITNCQQTINQLNTQVQNLLQNIQTLKAANADLRTQQASFQQQIDRLRAEVAAKEAEVATIPNLKLQVESQKIQIASLTALVQLIFQ